MTSTISITDSRQTRMDALGHANAVRVARCDARERIKRLPPLSGARFAEQIMLEPPEWANSMSLERLLGAIRGFGDVRIKQVAAGAATAQLGQLSYAVRAAIASECVRNAEHLSEGRRSPRPHIEQRTPQAQEALAEANRVRLARVQALARIAQAPNRVIGAFRAAGLIGNSRRGNEFDRVAVKKVLAAIPEVSATRVDELIAELGILESTQLGMLSETRSRKIAVVVRQRYGVAGSTNQRAAPDTEMAHAA